MKIEKSINPEFAQFKADILSGEKYVMRYLQKCGIYHKYPPHAVRDLEINCDYHDRAHDDFEMGFSEVKMWVNNLKAIREGGVLPRLEDLTGDSGLSWDKLKEQGVGPEEYIVGRLKPMAGWGFGDLRSRVVWSGREDRLALLAHEHKWELDKQEALLMARSLLGLSLLDIR